MIIYIDNNFKCHTKMANDLRAFKTSFFDDKCDTFIEGYRFIPAGEIWVREDGKKFYGEMIAPYVNYNILREAQLIYEKELAEQALNIIIGGE